METGTKTRSYLQDTAKTDSNFKARHFINYLGANSNADEWFDKLPMEEKKDWATIECSFHRRWLNKKEISIEESVTIEPEPVSTTSQSILPASESLPSSESITPDPHHETDTQDIPKGDVEPNESQDVTVASPTTTTTTTLLHPKPPTTAEATQSPCLDASAQPQVAPSSSSTLNFDQKWPILLSTSPSPPNFTTNQPISPQPPPNTLATPPQPSTTTTKSKTTTITPVFCPNQSSPYPHPQKLVRKHPSTFTTYTTTTSTIQRPYATQIDPPPQQLRHTAPPSTSQRPYVIYTTHSCHLAPI